MARVQKNPTKFSKRNRRFDQIMELTNMSTNAPAATGRNDQASTVRSKKGTTSRKGEGTK